MDWLAQSEVNFGMLVKGEMSPTRYREDMFMPPYDRGMRLFASGKGKGSIIQEIGLDAFQNALRARERLNGAGEELDWSVELDKTATNYKAGDEFERLSRKLKENKPVDVSKVKNTLLRWQEGNVNKFTDWNDVEEDTPDWQKTGVKFIDYQIGGVPLNSLTIIAGRAKVGKTSLVGGMLLSYLRVNPDRNAAIFTLEMMNSQLKKRMMKFRGGKEAIERGRLQLCDLPATAEEAVTWAASLSETKLIIVDFADYMIRGEVSEPKMAALMRTLALGSKELDASVILLAQLSRQYQGGIPRPWHVRYSGMAEALAALNIMLYVPWTDSYETPNYDEKVLPTITDVGYAIPWLSRYGTKKKSGKPFAIGVNFSSKTGWDVNDKGYTRDLKD